MAAVPIVNNYTLIMDLFYPASSSGSIRPNHPADDGFITPEADIIINAAGALGSAEGRFRQCDCRRWHRIAIVMNGSAQQLDSTLTVSRLAPAPFPESFDSRLRCSRLRFATT